MAPNYGTIESIGTVHCAAAKARGMSLATQSRIQGDNLMGKAGLALLDNTFSGMFDLYQDFTRAGGTIDAFTSLAVNGLRQGWPGGGPFSQGISGVAQDKALRLAFQNLGLETAGGATVRAAAANVGNAKVVYDGLTFGYAFLQCVF